MTEHVDKRRRVASPIVSTNTDDEADQPHHTVATEANPGGAYDGLYLDSVNRSVLDFDFEKVCSVSLAHTNVYACLVCGKYFQGRGKSSHAYFHSIHQDHHVYIHLTTLKVYILPEGYEVTDPSLDDIRHVIDPKFTPAQLAMLNCPPARGAPAVTDLARRPYLPGFIGISNNNHNDYVNVVVQALGHTPGFRDYFMGTDLTGRSELVQRFGLALRKLWNPRAFRGQLSLHELLQEVFKTSQGKFTATSQGDAADFMMWFLHHLHRGLGAKGRPPRTSMVYESFQGEMTVTTTPNRKQPVTMIPATGNDGPTEVRTSFLVLSLDLPPALIFQDEVEKNLVPQVPIDDLLAKFDGTTTQELPGCTRRYRLHRLPRYLILTVKRFTRTNFTTEKNPTLVTFPVTGLDVGQLTRFGVEKEGDEPQSCRYDLVANISHSGQVGKPDSAYTVDLRRPTGQWYRIQDLNVETIDPQRLFLSETYIQVSTIDSLDAKMVKHLERTGYS
ncbi:U4 U6.U5 tri-snRNP-associated protein [Tieghemiomyces parasiticus]|uniref:U4 U6.U5 tri-snRNP-associated protein n=1 Tax=Tieghemiomyces parasiticus TaxID=78921 RepID=A0A9W8AA16_9FUNG|nr:U4 U6.U5 tri-snRNP-associated protein [Tieghemiomyces parasiticus]